MRLDRLALWFLGASLMALVACGSSSSETDTDLPEAPDEETPEEPDEETPPEEIPDEDPIDEDPVEEPPQVPEPPSEMSWHWVHPGPQGYNLNAMLTDGNRFFAIGDFGAIMTSTDGEDWSQVHYDGGAQLRAITTNGEHYVAVGSRDRLTDAAVILYSDDGEHWHRADLDGEVPALNGVAWTDNSFVAMGNRTSTLMRSDDGITWTEEDIDLNVGSFAWGAGAVSALAASGQTLVAGSISQLDTSYNEGMDWTDSENFGNTGLNRTFRSATFDGENFLAVGGVGTYGLVTSSDGENWQETDAPAYMSGATPAKDEFFDVVRAENHYWVTDNRGSIDRRPVGTGSWSAALDTPNASTLRGIDYLDGTWVAVGDGGRILHSDDGEDWHELRSADGSEAMTGLAKNADGRLVATRHRSPLVYSDDGDTWTEIELPAGAIDFQTVTTPPDGSRFIAVGDGTIATSTDGENWEINTDFSLNFRYVAASDDAWVLGHYQESFSHHHLVRCTAIDDCEEVGDTVSPSALTWHEGGFVLATRGDGEDNPEILVSADGENWADAGNLALEASDHTNYITHLAGNDEALIAVRQVSPEEPLSVDIVVSLDGGDTWEAVVLDEDLERDTASAAVVGQALVIADYRNNRLWHSTDGVSWESSESAHRMEALVEKDGHWYAITTDGTGVLRLQ